MLIGHFDIQCNRPDNWELWPDPIALKVIVAGCVSVTEAKSKKRLFLEKEKISCVTQSNSKFLLLKPLGFNRLMVGGTSIAPKDRRI